MGFTRAYTAASLPDDDPRCPGNSRRADSASPRFSGPPPPMSTTLRLRPWQRAAFDQFRTSPEPDFLAVATPGAGKTTFALTCARWVLAERRCRVAVVAPTSHLKHQWALAAHRLGLELDPDWSPTAGLARDVHGLVTTYQQVATGDTAAKLRGLMADGFVMLDESPPRRRRPGLGRQHPHGVRVDPSSPGVVRHPVPQRHHPDPLRALRGRRDGARFRVRLRRRLARRRRRTARVLPPDRRRHGMDGTGRVAGVGHVRGRARRRPVESTAAHRPQPRRRMAPHRARAGPPPLRSRSARTTPTPAASPSPPTSTTPRRSPGSSATGSTARPWS